MVTFRAYRAVNVQRSMDSALTALRSCGSPDERVRWAGYARHARDLATLLRVDPGLIATVDYLDFTDPHAPVGTVMLTVIQPCDPRQVGFTLADAEATFLFAPHPSGGFWWLWPCSGCDRLTRLCRITDLADLGEFLATHRGLPAFGAIPRHPDPALDGDTRYCAFHNTGLTPWEDVATAALVSAAVPIQTAPRLAADALRVLARRMDSETGSPAGAEPPNHPSGSHSDDDEVQGLAATLGVDPTFVVSTTDPHRTAPGPDGKPHPQTLLTVLPPDDPLTYTFLSGIDGSYTLMWPCPRCAGPVPTRRIARLADLGYFLESHTDGDVDECRPEQFYGDPGHTTDCDYQRPHITLSEG